MIEKKEKKKRKKRKKRKKKRKERKERKERKKRKERKERKEKKNICSRTMTPPSASWVVVMTTILCVTAEDVILKRAGEDVTLPCRVSTVSDITKIMWTRPDLVSKGDVFYFREKRSYESNQLKCYRGRVELQDPELKAGDASLILRNVSVKDSGTYKCEVNGDKGRRMKRATLVQRSVDLQVTPGGDGEHPGPIARMSVGLLVFAVGVVGVGVLLWRKRNQRAAQPAAPDEVPLPTI